MKFALIILLLFTVSMPLVLQLTSAIAGFFVSETHAHSEKPNENFKNKASSDNSK